MDGHFVPNLTIGPPGGGLAAGPQRPVLRHPPDDHRPGPLPGAVPRRRGRRVHGARGGGGDRRRSSPRCATWACGSGLAANPDTPFEALEPYLRPGRPGAVHDGLPRVRRAVVHRRRDAQGGPGRGPPPTPPASTLDVEVDGGIDERTVVEAARAGANVFVAGSAVFNREDPLGAVGAILRGRRPTSGPERRPERPATRSTDDRRRVDAAGRRRRRAGPRPHLAQPVGRGPCSCPTGRRPARRPGSPGPPRRPGDPTPRWRPWPRPGSRARGGTLYVTLEPCAHHGRTPPCVDAVRGRRGGPGGRGHGRSRPAGRRAGDRRAAGRGRRGRRSAWRPTRWPSSSPPT